MRTYHIHSEIVAEQPTAVAEATLPVIEIGSWLASTFDAVARTACDQGIAVCGSPFARYRFVGGDRIWVKAGCAVSEPISADGAVQPSTLPGGHVAVTTHVGMYDDLAPAYEALAEWVHGQGAELAGVAWELYHSDPTVEPDPSNRRTEIVQPYRPWHRGA